MTYFHTAPSNRAPLSEADVARITALEARENQVTDFEQGELRALRMRADQGQEQRIEGLMTGPTRSPADLLAAALRGERT